MWYNYLCLAVYKVLDSPVSWCTGVSGHHTCPLDSTQLPPQCHWSMLNIYQRTTNYWLLIITKPYYPLLIYIITVALHFTLQLLIFTKKSPGGSTNKILFTRWQHSLSITWWFHSPDGSTSWVQFVICYIISSSAHCSNTITQYNLMLPWLWICIWFIIIYSYHNDDSNH